MSTDTILSVCPNLQVALSEAFREVGTREQLPFLEYIVSDANAGMIKQQISPGGGKKKTVEVRWIQRLLESEVQEGADINTCTSTNVYGDTTTTYSLDVTDTYQVSQLITGSEITDHCQENPRYVLENVLRLMDVLDRKVATAAATQAIALAGEWGTDVSSTFTVNGSDELVIATRQSGGQALNEFALADIRQATRMANYPTGEFVAFGSSEMERYVRAVQAGCCTQYGIDLGEISRQNGFGFAWDARVSTAFSSQNKVLAFAPGALQWISFNLAGWNANMPFQIGSNYAKVQAFTPAGVAVDVNMKDDCGNLSIVITATGKVVGLPSNIYESADKYAGVNYINKILITNP